MKGRVLALVIVLACSGLQGLAGNAAAADKAASDNNYPNRPVRWIVPYTPAGTTDILARIMSQWLTQHTGQQFVVDNRPGAGNNIGTELAIKSAPDGYTVFLVNPANAINATLQKLNGEINAALADPGMKAKLAELGGDPIPGTPADFWKLHAAETEKWVKVVRASGAKAE